jgi:FkbM family methyltransferase
MSVIKKIKYKLYLKNDLKRRLKIINHCQIDVLFDIGANVGQYAKKMRNLGYNNKIISFEPLKVDFEILKRSASHDRSWIVNNYALGNEDTTGFINISGSSDNSSILNMMPKHSESKSELGYIGRQEIEIKKLDTIFSSFVKRENNVMIKIDTQGYEKNVVDGATESLKNISIIQLEMSIVPLYEGEMLFTEMIKYLENKGFELFSLENGHYNRQTGQLLQVDGIFVNKTSIEH